MVAANRGFVRKNRVATKRALRAFLKATDICALEPERVARQLVEKKYASREESSPQKIIAEGTDWRFLDELKKELKAWRTWGARLGPPTSVTSAGAA